MTPLFIDTAYVIALVNRRDRYHSQAVALARRYAGYPLLTSSAVLLEIGNAFAQHFRTQAVTIIEEFLFAPEVEVVHVTPELFTKALDLYKYYDDKAWGLVDCISFVLMREYGVMQVLTPDQHFVQAGFQILLQPPSHR